VEESDLLSAVGEREIASFRDKGAVVIRDLISPGWIERLRAVFDEAKAGAMDLSNYYTDTPGKAPAGSSLTRDDVWMHNAVVRRFLFESPIARAAALVMNSRSARIYEDLLIYKSAGSEVSTPWHQDEPQWPLSGQQMSSVWFALEPVRHDEGALRFVEGSHKGPMYVPYVPQSQRHRLEADMPFFTGGKLPAIDAEPDRFKTMCFDLEPGDAIIFHPRTIHAALGTATDRPRRTFSIRFLGDDVRWEPKSSVFLNWLSEIDLKKGDPITGERFPEIWSAGD